ncbi:right-handed parallel beta-helix repeat-containing protein [Halobacteria archaeon AArc-curdl1]|uniref:Right-handed parallel beta-helix repeat-containing protein n=1 Tax=Natronosalvus hydrolyticus TaxID=2979988 RepID=A0AAP2ZB43_9EURY|nr:right-handed parallel beta-helix repeat-containing protein [Halobacteria archaeon AArc-curdl1]
MILALSTVAIATVGLVEAADEGPTEVTTCQEISQPGAYVLADNLSPSEADDLALDSEEHSFNACIAINASGVTLNGGGYTVDGTEVQNEDDEFYGIYAGNLSPDAGFDEGSELTDVTVTNVTVEEWYRGIRFHVTRQSSVTDVIGTSEDVVQDRAIHLSHSHEATIEGNHVEGTSHGIYLTDSNLGTVRDNSIDDVNIHGIGSSGDYTEIRDNEITNIGQSSSAAGVVLETADHATIADNRFVGGGTGIETSYYSDRPLIQNNTFEGVDSGTAMTIGEGTHGDITTDEGSRYATVRNNTVDNYASGIQFYRQSIGAEIVDNTVTNVTNPGFIVTGGSDDALVENNSVSDSGMGLRLGADDSEVIDNEFAGNAYGIELTRTDGSTIHHNNVTGSAGAGLDVFGTNEGTVVANNSFVDGGDGIEIQDNDGVSGVTIRHNDVSDNARAGVRYDDLGSPSSEVGPHLLENDITNNAEEGIKDTHGVNVTYEGNYVANNGLEGFRLFDDAAGSTIRGNTIVGNGHDSTSGVAAIQIGDDWRGSSEAVTVEDNVVSDNTDTGIVVEVTPDVVVRNNSLSGHALDVFLDRSTEVVVEENTVETGLDIAAEETDDFRHEMADNEFQDGSPLYYVRGEIDPTVPADASQVIAVDADSMTIEGGEYDTAPAPFGVLVAASDDAIVEDVSITGEAKEGLRAEYLDESTIDGVSVSGTDAGIVLRHSTGTVIDGASITSVGDRAAEEGFGILVEAAAEIEIRDGEVLDAGENAIYVDGTDAAVVTNTTVDGAVQGVTVADGPEAVVSGNDVSDLDRYGIRVDNAVNATVANNSVTGVTSDIVSTWAALRVSASDGAVVSGNALTNNDATGLDVSSSIGAEILDNEIESNEIGLDTSGAGISGPANMIVTGNVIRYNTGDGVTDDGTREGGIGTLTDNTISNNGGAGVMLDGTEGVTLTGNDIERNGDAGISLDDAEDVTIRETVVDANGVGIEDHDSAGLVVEDTEITNNDGTGIDLDWTSGFEVRNSTISGHDSWSGTGLNGELSSSSVIADNVFESNQQAIELSEQRWYSDLVGVAIEVRGNDFVSNDGGVAVNAEADEVSIVDNSFESTSGLAAEYDVEDPEHYLNATMNWWSDESGPSGDVEDPVTGTTADGSGDEVGENVLFDPWLTSEPDDDPVDDEPEADLSVVGASLSETDVFEGDEVRITADVENDGDATGEYTAALEIDGTVVANETVSVGPGETHSVAFRHAFDTAGDYDVTVDGVEAGTVTVTEPETIFELSDVSVSEEDVLTGDGVTVSALLENTGTDDGEHVVSLEIDGTVVANQTVSVDAGETEVIEFTHAFADAGDYDVTVDGVEAGTVSVSEPPSTPSPSPSPSPDPAPETEVSVEMSDDGMTATVTGAVANQPTSIPIGDELGDEAPLSAMTITTAEDGDFDVTIRTTDGVPADADELPNAPAELLTLEIDTSLEADEIDTATLEFYVSGDELATHDLDAGDVTLYHLVDGEWTERDTDSSDLFPGSSWDSEELNELFPGSTWEEADEPSDLFPGSSWEDAEEPSDLFPGSTWEDADEPSDLFPGSTWEDADEPSDLFPGSSWDEAEEPADLFPGSSWDSEELNELFPGSSWEDAEEPSDLFPGSTWEDAEEPSDLFPGSSWDSEELNELFPGSTWDEADGPSDLFPGSSWEDAEEPSDLFPGSSWDSEELNELFPGSTWEDAEEPSDLFPGSTWEDAEEPSDLFPDSSQDSEELNELFPGSTWDEAEEPADLFPGSSWDEAEEPSDLFPGSSWDSEELNELFPGSSWDKAEEPSDLFPGSSWEDAEEPSDLFPGSSWDSEELNELFPGSTWDDAEEPSDLFPGSSWDSEELNDLFPGSSWDEAEEPSDLFPGSSWDEAEEPSDLFPGSSWDSEELNELFPGSSWDEAEEPSDLFPGSSWEETDVNDPQSGAYYSSQTPHFSAFALAGHQPDITVVDHSASETTLSVGEAVTFEATVQNDGGATGNYSVEIEVDDAVVATESVSVEPGAETEVTISYTFETTGEYALAVDGVDAGTAVVEDTTDDPDSSDDVADADDSDDVADADDSDDVADADDTDDVADADDGDDGLPGFGAVVALLALASVFVVARRR